MTEIVGQTGWQSGSSMTFIFSKRNGKGVRWAESSSDNGGESTPALHFSYTGGSTAVAPTRPVNAVTQTSADGKSTRCDTVHLLQRPPAPADASSETDSIAGMC